MSYLIMPGITMLAHGQCPEPFEDFMGIVEIRKDVAEIWKIYNLILETGFGKANRKHMVAILLRNEKISYMTTSHDDVFGR